MSATCSEVDSKPHMMWTASVREQVERRISPSQVCKWNVRIRPVLLCAFGKRRREPIASYLFGRDRGSFICLHFLERDGGFKICLVSLLHVLYLGAYKFDRVPSINTGETI